MASGKSAVMPRISLLFGIACLLSITVSAQEIATAEVYLGYSYIRTATGTQVNAFNNNGGLGALQYNLNEHFAIVGELGGYAMGEVSIKGRELSSVDQTYFSYHFGPRFSLNKEGRYTPFVHFLLGGVHESRSFAVPNSLIPPDAVVPPGMTATVNEQTTRFRSTQSAFAMTVGGGLDIRINPRIAVRPMQVDYLPSRFSAFNVPGIPSGFNDTNWQHNLRYSAGVVFRFGGAAEPVPRF